MAIERIPAIPGAQKRVGREVLVRTPHEPFRAYVPKALPPKPPVEVRPLEELIELTNQSVGRLDGITAILPDTDLFIYMYVRKEALLSSQIEGTQSSLSELLAFENEEAPGAPVEEGVGDVSRYIAAMTHGLDRIRKGFPLSLRLIREIHGVLMEGARGGHQSPGEFRKTQNWIGGTRPGNATFVPPPPHEMMECLDAFEKYLHAPRTTPVLVKAALVHAQFETIHPFLDGNGRLGRLLITFLLCSEGVLQQPALYLSLYLKRHRTAYYDLLQRVRTTGDWEGWVRFFLEGAGETATQAVMAARQIFALLESDRHKIEGLGRPAASALRLHRHLERRPILSIATASRALQLSIPTVESSMRHLQQLGIAEETTGMRKRRLFAYKPYMDILAQGTEPIPPARL